MVSERSQAVWDKRTVTEGDPDGNGTQAPYLSPVSPGTPSLPTSSLFSGKFGAVCTCTEKATGLKLAAKVIKKQTPKDKVVGAGCMGV